MVRYKDENGQVVVIDNGTLVDENGNEISIENKIDDICNIAATCADAALEFFEFNKEYMTKKEKKEISKKEHNKQSYR